MKPQNDTRDTIKFVREAVVKDDSKFALATIYIIYINGKNLIDILREYELPFGRQEGFSWLAGNYRNIPVPLNPLEYFLGKDEAWFGETQDKTTLMDYLACGFLVAGRSMRRLPSGNMRSSGAI